MDLKDTITKWHSGMCLLEDENCLDEAVSMLLSIKAPSAKIFHNIGCIRMRQTLYSDAIQVSLNQVKKCAGTLQSRKLYWVELEDFKFHCLGGGCHLLRKPLNQMPLKMEYKYSNLNILRGRLIKCKTHSMLPNYIY